MPFGYLEFSRAIGRELCPHMRARAAAGGGSGRRWRRARARVWVWVRVPYPAWFFLNRVSRVWAAPLPAPDPLRSGSKPPANGCLKTVCAVGRLDRTVATVQSEPLQLLENSGRKCPSRSAINSAPVSLSQTHQTRNNLSLSLSSELKRVSELGSGVLKQLPARSGKVSFRSDFREKEILQNSF